MASSKVPFTFVYRKPGTNPPIYIAGTFSTPPWNPLEMEWTTGEDGEHTFTLKSEIDPTKEVQYKFRIGPGDWWVVSEDAPTTSDDLGNVNNVIKPTVGPVELPSTDDAGSTTGTEQSEEIPSPSHVPTVGTNVIIHDETTGLLDREHEVAAVMPKPEDGKTAFISCLPIQTGKSMDRAQSSEEDEKEAQQEKGSEEQPEEQSEKKSETQPEDQPEKKLRKRPEEEPEVQADKDPETQPEAQPETQPKEEPKKPGDEKPDTALPKAPEGEVPEEHKQTETHHAESSYESAPEEATATGTDTAAPDASGLRNRGAERDQGQEATDVAPPPALKINFFQRFMEWLRDFFRFFARGFRAIFSTGGN